MGSGYGDVCQGLGEVYARLGRLTESDEAFRQALTAYRTVEHHAMACWTAAGALALLVLPYWTDDLNERQRLLRESEEAARRAGETIGGLPPNHSVLPLLALEGMWSEARQIAQQLLARPHNALVRCSAASSLAPLSRNLGETELAWSLVQEFIPEGPSVIPGTRQYAGTLPLLRLAAELALDAADLPLAAVWLETFERWLDWSHTVLDRADGYLLRARYHLAEGKRSLARQVTEQAFRRASDPRQPLALIAVHRFLGKLDTDDRRFADAERHLEESLGLAEACAAPFERALTLLDLAELRFVQRQIDRARSLVDQVQAICEPLGAMPTLERVDALRQEIQQVVQKAPSYPAGLTQREVEVLQLVAEGMTNAEIADRLFLSRRTVEHHIGNIYNKISIGSRAAAAVWAKEQGII